MESPEGSIAGNVEVVEGSFFATVHVDSQEVGREVVYTVRAADGTLHQVQRQMLRHQRWHWTASDITPSEMASEWRAAGFTLREVVPPALEVAARGGRRMYGTGLRQLQGMGPKRFVLFLDNNNEFRSQCE